MVSSFLVLLACLASLGVGSATVVEVVSELDCQRCCERAVQDVSLNSFDLNACRIQGCTLSQVDVTGEDIQCNRLQVDRDGCELGRDFRFMGFTKFLGNTTFHACTNGEIQQVAIDESFQNPLDGQIEVQECRDCANELNVIYDEFTPNDFQVSDSQLACTTSSFCFDEENHRQRLGCAIGVDLLRTGQVTIRAGTFSCVNGAIVEVNNDDGGNNDNGGNDDNGGNNDNGGNDDNGDNNENDDDGNSIGTAVALSSVGILGVVVAGLFMFRRMKRKANDDITFIDPYSAVAQLSKLPPEGDYKVPTGGRNKRSFIGSIQTRLSISTIKTRTSMSSLLTNTVPDAPEPPYPAPPYNSTFSTRANYQPRRQPRQHRQPQSRNDGIP